MDATGLSPRRIAVALGYGLLGLVGTAALALVAVVALQEGLAIQRRVYHATYHLHGPSEASELGVLVHAVLAGAVAIALTTLGAASFSTRIDDRRAYGAAVGAVALLVVVFVAVSLLVEASVLWAFLWVAALAVAVPVLLRVGWDVRSGGVPAFLGGVPALVLLLLLAAFGLGWGGGHVVVATELSTDRVEGDVATLEGAPEFREDLFAADNCETTADGHRRCRLVLRGYEHELTAARTLDRLGVRCPHRTEGGGSGAVVVRHEGSEYRVTCASFGD